MPLYTQEMPPKGGYSPIDVFRKMPKRTTNGILVLIGLYTSTYVGLTYQKYIRESRAVLERENEENRLALTPFLLAEQERMYLKQIRRNRDYEESLMHDVPGWKVGHWYDYPVFHNPRGLWCDPNVDEFYAHTTHRFRNNRVGVAHQYI